MYLKSSSLFWFLSNFTTIMSLIISYFIFAKTRELLSEIIVK